MKTINYTENCIAFEGRQEDCGFKTICLQGALDYCKKIKKIMDECPTLWNDSDPIQFKVIKHKQLGAILYLDYRN